MKRYIVFAWSDGEAAGHGWDDFVGDADTMDEAWTVVARREKYLDSFHIVDRDTKQVVADDLTKWRR